MRLLIGIPAYGDHLRINCVNALLGLTAALPAHGIAAEVSFVSAARIELVRNLFASKVLNEDRYTHLLFVDSDVGFRPEAVLRMLKKDVGVAACTYPSRQLDLAAFADQARRQPDNRKALARALNWPPLGEAAGEIRIEDGWVKVEQAPTGLMLIKREVFVALAGRFPELKVESLKHNAGLDLGPTLQCFSPFRREDGVLLGEDVSFCRRWREAGGEIHLLVDEPLSHAGLMTFEAGFVEALLD